MHELVQRLARDTGLLMKLESSDTHTTVKAFDQHGLFLGLRTFSQRSFEDCSLLEPALENFAQLLRIHRASDTVIPGPGDRPIATLTKG